MEHFQYLDENRMDGENIYTILLTVSDMTDRTEAPVAYIEAHGRNTVKIAFNRLSNPNDYAYVNTKGLLKNVLADNVPEDDKAVLIIFEYMLEQIGRIEYDLIVDAMREFMIEQQENGLYVLIAEHRKNGG